MAEERASTLALLAKSPEFAELKKIIQGQIDIRKKLLNHRLVTAEDMAEHNVLAGEISGMETVICWPDRVAKNLDLNEEIKTEMEKINGRSE